MGGKSIARLNFKEIAESLLQVRPPKGDSLTCRPVHHLQKQPEHPRAEAAHGTEQGRRGAVCKQIQLTWHWPSTRARCRTAISAGQAARHTSHHGLHLPRGWQNPVLSQEEKQRRWLSGWSRTTNPIRKCIWLNASAPFTGLVSARSLLLPGMQRLCYHHTASTNPSFKTRPPQCDSSMS